MNPDSGYLSPDHAWGKFLPKFAAPMLLEKKLHSPACNGFIHGIVGKEFGLTVELLVYGRIWFVFSLHVFFLIFGSYVKKEE